MKLLILTALCTATVEEAWRFEVPADFDLSGTPEEVYDRAMGEHESPPGVKFLGCENVEVNDERDREFRAMGTESPTDARPRATCGCGYELVWVAGGWEHDAPPSLWGDDHDAHADEEPDPAAREHWDREDGVA